MHRNLQPLGLGLLRPRHVDEHAILSCRRRRNRTRSRPTATAGSMRRSWNAGTICAWPSTNTGFAVVAAGALCCATSCGLADAARERTTSAPMRPNRERAPSVMNSPLLGMMKPLARIVAALSAYGLQRISTSPRGDRPSPRSTRSFSPRMMPQPGWCLGPPTHGGAPANA